MVAFLHADGDLRHRRYRRFRSFASADDRVLLRPHGSTGCPRRNGVLDSPQEPEAVLTVPEIIALELIQEWSFHSVIGSRDASLSSVGWMPMETAHNTGSSLPVADLETQRLKLRRWRPDDLEPFARMNADPRVMEFFPGTLSRAESDALAARIQQHFNDHGFGLWAVEIPDVTPFAGFIGLFIPRFEAHFTPCVEIGWRLAAEYWGHGFATEGARSVLDHAFRVIQLAEVVSMTAQCNHRSRRVMERIRMTHTPDDDFQHPLLPPGDRLSHHVLYRADARRARTPAAP